MHLYRVDKRYFKNNEIITPDTTFEEKMNEFQLEIESNLDKLKPSHIPTRKECLYLFENLSSALLFCSKYGGNIYAVEVECKDIYYKADMNKLENINDIFKITHDNDIRNEIILKYWDEGSHTFQPCYEFLTKQAKVKKVILERKNTKELIKSEIQEYGNIENSKIFISTLKENENYLKFSSLKQIDIYQIISKEK